MSPAIVAQDRTDHGTSPFNLHAIGCSQFGKTARELRERARLQPPRRPSPLQRKRFEELSGGGPACNT
ncbi:hypothetical protein N177_2386 [Lutibaculum baratangense AMV1]|uniref:Uncharacterized protein n=1 Tax=Lutibaculum baratangense AMV1 TaxID=631454 RepID=V4QXT2_9HYPH|nr:hypothetical protein N177_2386 [Lutibaculum baratangense AMV1]